MKMRERIARIIANLCDENEGKWESWLAWADAILEELMKPDQEMVDGAKQAFIGGHPAQDISVSLRHAFVGAIYAAKTNQNP
jgi:hypothetical protein